jgi:hypothetical protein
MPGQFLTTIERERLSRIPGDISKADLASFFTLTDSDLNAIPVKSVGAMVYFVDKVGGTSYEGVTDVEEQTPFLPDVGGEPLTVKIDKTIEMRKLGKGGKGKAEPLWTVDIGYAVYTRTE